MVGRVHGEDDVLQVAERQLVLHLLVVPHVRRVGAEARVAEDLCALLVAGDQPLVGAEGGDRRLPQLGEVRQRQLRPQGLGDDVRHAALWDTIGIHILMVS